MKRGIESRDVPLNGKLHVTFSTLFLAGEPHEKRYICVCSCVRACLSAAVRASVCVYVKNCYLSIN